MTKPSKKFQCREAPRAPRTPRAQRKNRNQNSDLEWREFFPRSLCLRVSALKALSRLARRERNRDGNRGRQWRKRGCQRHAAEQRPHSEDDAVAPGCPSRRRLETELAP